MVYRWGESPGVSWLVLHVQEIKELLRRWKGGGATALLPNSEGRRWREDKDAGGKNSGEKKKKKRQREIRNEEKIGKRAIREGKQ